MPTANREYKDRLFIFIFGNSDRRDWTLTLYNAVGGTDHKNPDDVEMSTVREVLYLGMRNDVSFIVGNEISLYEQQSTRNPNMPLRMLQYAGSAYEGYIARHHLNKYGKKRIKLPAPRIVTFYNGLDALPDEKILRLSDSYPMGATGDIEVCVRVINVNPGKGEAIKSACGPLQEYCWIVERIRDNLGAGMERLDAVTAALGSMPHDFEIRPYLMEHKAEVIDMLLTEYDEAEAMELFREEGRNEGIAQSIRNLMDELATSAERAMDLLRIPAKDRPRYLSML